MHIKEKSEKLLKGKTKILLLLTTLALLFGNFVGWTTIFREVDKFCNVQGRGLLSLTDFTGTATKNPLLTPCFWGSIVFLITFAWSLYLLMEKDASKVRSQLKKLWLVLLGGTLFALANNIPLFYHYYTKPAGTAASCSAGTVSNPFFTSCFLGLSAFLAAFMFATLAKYVSVPKITLKN